MKYSLFAVFAAVLFAGTTLWAAQPAKAKAQRPAPPKADVQTVYKSTPEGELKLYIYRPADWKESDKRPLMLMYHGGGWRGGGRTSARPPDDGPHHAPRHAPDDARPWRRRRKPQPPRHDRVLGHVRVGRLRHTPHSRPLRALPDVARAREAVLFVPVGALREAEKAEGTIMVLR